MKQRILSIIMTLAFMMSAAAAVMPAAHAAHGSFGPYDAGNVTWWVEAISSD